MNLGEVNAKAFREELAALNKERSRPMTSGKSLWEEVFGQKL